MADGLNSLPEHGLYTMGSDLQVILDMLSQWLPRNHAVERVLQNKILPEQEYLVTSSFISLVV